MTVGHLYVTVVFIFLCYNFKIRIFVADSVALLVAFLVVIWVAVLILRVSSLSDSLQRFSEFLSIFWIQFHHEFFILLDI